MQERPVTCIIAATLIEAEPFIKLFSMVHVEKAPVNIYKAENIILAVCGIGKANAAIATSYCCAKYHPGCIINTGAAGAVDKNCNVGKIFQVEKTIEPDRPHLKTGTPWIQFPDTLNGFDNAVLATQDKPIGDIETFNELSDYSDLVDMEGASVLQAARRFDTKCLLFKFVSDTPRHAGKGGIVESIKKHINPFCEFIISSVIPPIEDLLYHP